MDVQINTSDQSTRKTDNNLGTPPVQIREKEKVNLWMISTFVLGFLLLLMVPINLLGLRKTTQTTPSPSPSASPTKPLSQTSFSGTVKTGAELGEIKSYCSNGLYLVADEGSYLVNQTKMLQLRLPNQSDETKMFSDQKYVDKKVKVVGKYPAQKTFCLALICECEDYILVDSISITASASNTTDNEWKSYQTNNFSIKYPSNWRVSTKQIEYYDFPTLELTNATGTKMASGYELPEVWIGSFEIYSTSGAICANEPSCEKVDKISFTVEGKNYSADVFKKQIWESGKFTGKYYYVFQIGSQSELDSIPSKPTITGQYVMAAEKSEIESILSTITY